MTGYGVGGLETGASWDRRTPTQGLGIEGVVLRPESRILVEGCKYQYLSLKPETTLQHVLKNCVA